MQLLKLSLVLTSSALFSTAALSSKLPRIIGGEAAYQGQFVFSAAINVQTPQSHFFCGGSLIHVSWVMTSGHCAITATLFTIHFGSVNLVEEDPNRVTVAASTYFTHAGFNPNAIQNDLALIRLRMPMTLTEYVGLVPLPTEELVIPGSLITLGYGQTSDSDSSLSDDLRYVEVTSISLDECRMYYGSQIDNRMLCAIGNYNEGTCIGDTGSALVSTSDNGYVVDGISSFIGSNGCESTYPSGYTRVYPYMAWIMSRLNANNTSSALV